MKKSIISAWAILCMLPLFLSFHEAPAPVHLKEGIKVKTVPVAKKKSFVLRMYNLQQKPVRIYIQDDQGHTFYSEKILNHNGYRKMISLHNFELGEYNIKILHPLESKAGVIKVGPRSVEINWEEG